MKRPVPRLACVHAWCTRATRVAPPVMVQVPSLVCPVRALHHHSLIAAPTAICYFDIKQHELEKRRRRELERAGIDAAEDEDAPWIAPEEQARLDAAEAERRAELEEKRKALLEQRQREDAERRSKFREFRARQLAMSKERKEMAAAKKAARGGVTGLSREQVMEGEETTASGATTNAEAGPQTTTTPSSPREADVEKDKRNASK